MTKIVIGSDPRTVLHVLISAPSTPNCSNLVPVEDRHMDIRRLIVFVVAVAAALAIPGSARAQTERGSITGVVSDSTKAALPGVTVKVINTATTVATTLVSS